MYTCGLCRQIEIASSCQGKDGCARTIGRSGEVDGDVVDRHRVAVLEAHAAAAAHPRADPAVPGVEQHGQPRLGEHLVERIGEPVVRHELLERRVQLEPAHAAPREEPPGFVHRGLAARRVEAHEGERDVGVRGGEVEHGVVRHLGPSAQALVDREHHAGHPARAVVRGERVPVGVGVGLEVLPGRLVGRAAAFGGVQVDVDVDRREPRDVEPGRGRPRPAHAPASRTITFGAEGSA
jgi:hypothetical protein